ncbi:intradiol ring-cleavage dioxygenase [Ensifer sp. ENS07]|uniref:intradiol ring-cleavage dioxygenase n=1 Tax=unclassified Ensifer TaxID=2633371 RepID=UPI00177FDCCE|nr:MULTISPECIES: intradiol ring-cleavage dioxygenase [unclassified Ensifer]MBD9508137.1 intradiol ring-cleavage dioxygenase [Ensifer sp. ENS10]MBD9637367.1 intradiol ring-cleavage dioxygenase [Ensifer sp. ENS07]
MKPASTSEETRFLTEENSVETVNARMGSGASPRMRLVMSAVVKHLHALTKEIEPTHQEWQQAIDFLTAVGHKCTDWRQEFILLSDVLGVSMLVETINNRRPSGATENTVLGPFYVPEAPRYRNGANICLDGKGEPLVVRGRVTDLDGNPIPGALVDVWQTNNDGFYDVQQKDIQPDWNLRGVFTADDDGTYWYRSAKPRYYPIPDDGPVGRLLGQLDRHPNRAAHIHFIVSAPGYDPVVTHIFPDDCSYLSEDAVFGVRESLIAHFKEVHTADEAERLGLKDVDQSCPYFFVNWDFVLTPAAK